MQSKSWITPGMGHGECRFRGSGYAISNQNQRGGRAFIADKECTTTLFSSNNFDKYKFSRDG